MKQQRFSGRKRKIKCQAFFEFKKKNASKRCEFLRFYLYLCHVLLRFILALNCNTKIGKKSDMTKSWALGFAACHKQELFVAQELINKVKIKVLRN